MAPYIRDWPKTAITSAVYTTVLLLLFVLRQDVPLFLIWIQTPVYFLHQFEEYIWPGGFLRYFNTRILGSTDPALPLDVTRSFWINVPFIFVAFPVSAVLAGEFGLAWGLWAVYFSIVNALSHVAIAILHRCYNPGLAVSLGLNIPVGAFTLFYIGSHRLVSGSEQIIGLLIGVGVQAGMMIYGFAILKPSIPVSQRIR